ncbi:MAG: ABC transporter ATP-binding protein, partial [Pseudomonadota bacterium]
MIRALLNVVGLEVSSHLKRNFIGLVAEAILMGVGFVLLVPLLNALFSSDLATAWRWLFVLIGVLIVYAVVRYCSQIAGYRAAISLMGILFSRLGDHIARLPLGWFAGERVGQLSRLTSQGVIDVMGMPAHFLRPLITGLATPATVVVLMFVFDWRLALAALISAPILGFVYRWSGDLVQRTDHRVHAAATDAASRIVEFAQSQTVLRAFGRRDRDLGKLDAALVEQHAAGRVQIFSVARGLVSFVLAVQLAFSVIFLFGISLALGGTIDAAELVALLVLAVRYVEPLIIAADLGGAIRIARNSLTRMDDLFASKPLPEPNEPLTPEDSAVTFDHISFAYADSLVLDDVSFVAPEGKITAIVGPSGAGKTTLLRLVARFWDVGKGVVRVGGIDVRDVTTETLMQRIAIVFQDVYLFDGTIIENIRLGRPDASDDEVEAAAKLAHVDVIAARLANGLFTRVGEGGNSLSGGERQCVSIARAILKDAPIVLLDEATAALDPLSEVAVQSGLRALASEKT